jgi:hypothetical protein
MSPDIVVIGPWAEHDEIAVEGGRPTHFRLTTTLSSWTTSICRRSRA